VSAPVETRPDLVVRRWGSGPPVVLVHGAVAGAHASWAHLRADLSAWTLLAPNRRGYHPRTPALVEDYQADAEDIVELLVEPAHVVGHSYGAVVALAAAARAPDQVRTLTLIEPPPLPGTHHLPYVRDWLEQMRALRQHGPTAPDEFLRRFLALVGGPADVGQRADQIANQLRLLRSSRPAWSAEVDVAGLRGSAIPSLVVSGGHSPVFEAAADDVATSLGAARRVLPAAGHFVQRDARFARVLKAFLNPTCQIT
jgi:pimeloyl-ACP methyl ester carboxylesterase